MRTLILFSLTLIMFSCNNKANETVETPTNADRVKKIYDAFGEGDIEAVIAGFSKNIEWNEAENYIYSDGNPYIGGDAILEGVFQRVGEEWEYWNIADPKFHNVEEDKVLVTGRYQAKNKATGKLLDAQFAHLWTMTDTLVASFQQYTDTKQAAEIIMPNSNETEENK